MKKIVKKFSTPKIYDTYSLKLKIFKNVFLKNPRLSSLKKIFKKNSMSVEDNKKKKLFLKSQLHRKYIKKYIFF